MMSSDKRLAPKRTIDKQQGHGRRFFSSRTQLQNELLNLYFKFVQGIWQDKFMPMACEYYDEHSLSSVIAPELQHSALRAIFNAIFNKHIQRVFLQNLDFDAIVSKLYQVRHGSDSFLSWKEQLNEQYRDVVEQKLTQLCHDNDYYIDTVVRSVFCLQAGHEVLAKKQAVRTELAGNGLDPSSLEGYLSARLDNYADKKYIDSIAQLIKTRRPSMGYARAYESKFKQLKDFLENTSLTLNSYYSWVLDETERMGLVIEQAIDSNNIAQLNVLERGIPEILRQLVKISDYLSGFDGDQDGGEIQLLKQRLDGSEDGVGISKYIVDIICKIKDVSVEQVVAMLPSQVNNQSESTGMSAN